MLRFIFNFFLFGLLFFIIYKFFPDAFATLVDWVGKVYDTLAEWGRAAVEWVNSAKPVAK